MIDRDDMKSFINNLLDTEENLFPYLYNQNYEKGISNIYYSGPYWDHQEIESAITNLFTGKWLASGESVNKFEHQFSKKFNFKHSVMVNSGSSANLVMIAALKKYFGWQDGDEIIVCVCGFPTTINPIIQNNLKPVFVDIDYLDLNWDIKEIEKKVKIGVSVDPELPQYFKDKSINLSSLVNKLLKEYIKNGDKSL